MLISVEKFYEGNMSKLLNLLNKQKFTPLRLGNLELWLDGSDINTITKDGSNLISQWNDKSGNASHTTQTIGSNQPTYAASGQNRKSIITFDGGDFLTMPSATYTIPNNNNTIFIVLKHGVSTTNDRIINMEESGASKYSVEYKADGTIAYHNSATGTAVSATLTETNFTIVTSYLSGTTQSIAVNGGTATTNASGNTGATITAAAIGGNATGTGQLLEGSIAEIIIYTRALPAVEIKLVNRYLSNKWGIALS